MALEIATMTDGAKAQDSDLLAASRSGTAVRLSATQLSARNLPHPRYHFYGYAGDQLAGDSKFFDRSGMLNHGIRGANLSDAQMFTNAGYVSTIDPAGGATDSVIRIPNLNFDYNGGEKLILWWLGKGTAEGANANWIGDGDSATYPGVTVRCTATTGTMQPYIRDSVGAFFSGTTSQAVMNGNLNSFAFILDGQNKKVCCWVNDTLDTNYGSGYLTFSTGSAADSRTSNTFNIGQPKPAAAASTEGMAIQTRALHILRLAPTDTMPDAATMTAIFKQLRANPGKPILGGAF